MKQWIATILLLLASLSLANPGKMAAFTTPDGYGAIAVMVEDTAGILLQDHPYTLAIHFSNSGPLVVDLYMLASLVDMVVGWADARQVALGYQRCELEVFVSTTAGSVDQVSAVNCAGEPVVLWYMFHLPPLEYTHTGAM